MMGERCGSMGYRLPQRYVSSATSVQKVFQDVAGKSRQNYRLYLRVFLVGKLVQPICFIKRTIINTSENTGSHQCHLFDKLFAKLQALSCKDF